MAFKKIDWWVIREFLKDEWPLTLVVVMGVVGTALFALGVITIDKQEKEFMAECLQYQKKYECTALWRQGEKNDTYIPIIIPSPTR